MVLSYEVGVTGSNCWIFGSICFSLWASGIFILPWNLVLCSPPPDTNAEGEPCPHYGRSGVSERVRRDGKGNRTQDWRSKVARIIKRVWAYSRALWNCRGKFWAFTVPCNMAQNLYLNVKWKTVKSRMIHICKRDYIINGWEVQMII